MELDEQQSEEETDSMSRAEYQKQDRVRLICIVRQANAGREWKLGSIMALLKDHLDTQHPGLMTDHKCPEKIHKWPEHRRHKFKPEIKEKLRQQLQTCAPKHADMRLRTFTGTAAQLEQIVDNVIDNRKEMVERHNEEARLRRQYAGSPASSVYLSPASSV